MSTKKCKDPNKKPEGKNGRCIKPKNTTKKSKETSEEKLKSSEKEESDDLVAKIYILKSTIPGDNVDEFAVIRWKTLDVQNINEDEMKQIAKYTIVQSFNVYKHQLELQRDTLHIVRYLYFVKGDTTYFKRKGEAQKYKKEHKLKGEILQAESLHQGELLYFPLQFTSEEQKRKVLAKYAKAKKEYEEHRKKMEEKEEARKGREEQYRKKTKKEEEAQKRPTTTRCKNIQREYDELKRKTNASSAYKKMALKYHPDKNADKDDTDFKFLNNIHSGISCERGA